MENKDLEKFDPSVAELTKMVLATKGITATDLKDKAQLAIVRENRIALKNARVKITKIGKDLRDDANKFASAVIAKEKSLIAIIEPEEDRLEAIEEEAKALIIREERLEKLPARKERLTAIDNRTKWATDDELLEMDSTQFETFFNQCVAENNENLRVQALEEQAEKERIAKQEQDERDAKIKAEQDKKQAELDAKEKKIADERAKIEKEKLEIAHKKEVEDEKKITILGRPITLTDVLLAINKYDEQDGVDIPDKKFEDVMWKWDWDKPYDDQSQETKDFIGNILGVK